MKLNKIITASLILAMTFVSCQREDPAEHHFDNKLYITTTPVDDGLLIKDDITGATRSISVRLAMPAENDVTVTFEARPQDAALYNTIYGDNAFALPKDNFELPKKKVTISAGAINGEDLVINFVNTNQLSGKYRYVLPVTISECEGMDVLESKRTVYFVFKGAAMINVTADIHQRFFSINWSSSARPLVQSMSTITVEALVNSPDWVDGRGNALSTVFGIEGHFLVRIGDADRPRDQLQLVCPNGNWPDPNVHPGLPVNEWVHIAVVWDSAAGERIYYVNGEQVAYGSISKGYTINLARGNCFIGYAWDDTRWLPGCISELRVWNVQRTADEIAKNMYGVNPETEGLVAYWKFNEGAGGTITDYSPYKTNINSENGEPTWVPVELPVLK